MASVFKKVKLEEIKVDKRFRQDLGELDGLRDSIDSRGLQSPIIVDQELNLVAGGRRHAVLTALGRKTTTAKITDETDPTKLKLMEIEENTQRKQHNLREVLEISDFLKRAVGNRRGRPKAGEEKNPPFLGDFSGDTSEWIARTVGKGKTTLEQMWKVRKAGVPRVVDAMLDETISVNVAYDISRYPKNQQKTKLEEAIRSAGIKKTKGRNALEKDRQRKRLEKAGVPDANPTEPVEIVYVSPYWKDEYSPDDRMKPPAGMQPLSPGDVCALPVADYLADNALVFLRANARYLAHAVEALESWGAEYQECVYMTSSSNMLLGPGRYVDQCPQVLLIGRVGAYPPPDKRVAHCHDRKSVDAFMQLIESMYTTKRRLDFFGKRRGWTHRG